MVVSFLDLSTHMQLTICCYCLQRQIYYWKSLPEIRCSRLLFSSVGCTTLLLDKPVSSIGVTDHLGIPFSGARNSGFRVTCSFLSRSSCREKVSSFIFTLSYFSAFSDLSWHHSVWIEKQQSLLCYFSFFHHDLTFLPVFSPMKYCSTLSGRTCNGSLACRKFSCAYCKCGTCPKQLNGVYEKVM